MQHEIRCWSESGCIYPDITEAEWDKACDKCEYNHCQCDKCVSKMEGKV